MEHQKIINISDEQHKMEKRMLDNLNTQNFDPENYMEELDDILDTKLEGIFELKKQLKVIKQQLKQEKVLNQQFQQLKS